MGRFCLAGIALFMVGLVFPVYVFSQNQGGNSSAPVTIPEALRRPQGGEAPRYPRDMVIGELGRGTAPEMAWRYAREIAAVLTAAAINQSESFTSREDSAILKEYLPALEPVEPRRYHLGGGRTEVDGSVSFLVRFIGREQWVAGEFYLLPEEDGWRLDEIILEEARTLEEAKNTYTYDFSPYERFF